MESIFNDNKVVAVLVGAIVGGIMTFFVTWIKDFIIEKKKQKEKEKQLKRERLEELFILLNKYNKNMIMPLQLQNDIEQERLTMLVRFYFEPFKKEFDDYVMKCAEITQLKVNQKDYTSAVLTNLPKKLHLLNRMIVEESKKL